MWLLEVRRRIENRRLMMMMMMMITALRSDLNVAA